MLLTLCTLLLLPSPTGHVRAGQPDEYLRRVERLSQTAQNELINIVTIFLGLVGSN
jgi:Na+-transporting methylmalonyl-CoA/oxaloacetate decarboxylase beta subunit